MLNREESWKYYAMWKQLDTEGYCMIPFIWMSRTGKSIKTENKLVVDRSWGRGGGRGGEQAMINGCGISLRDVNNVLELVVKAAQPWEYIKSYWMVYSKRMNSMARASPTSGIQYLMIWGGADVIRREIKCTINGTCLLNHPETIPSASGSWKNCLPQNRSLAPKRLETAVVWCMISINEKRIQETSTGVRIGLRRQAMGRSHSQWRVPWIELG